MTRVSVSKWGNSLAIRLPKHLIAALGLTTGSEIAVEIEAGQLIGTPVRRRVPLTELVKGITTDNRHSATDWGAPVGNEVW